MMLCYGEGSLARRRIDAPSDSRRASILDDLVIEALQPLSVLEIGAPGELLGGGFGAAVRKVGSQHEAVRALAQHEFDAIVLGSGLADAWLTAAYERIAELAGSTPVLVQADFVAPMAGIKQRQGRDQDVILGTAKPSLLARLILAAILRSRTLAEEPGAQIG